MCSQLKTFQDSAFFSILCNYSALFLQCRIIQSRQCIATPRNLVIFPITSFLYSFLPGTGTWLVHGGTGQWVLGQYRAELLGT